MKPKCDISKCHASCCYNVPMTKFTLFSNKKRIVNSFTEVMEHGEDEDGRKLYIPVVSTNFHENKCPFLRDDCKCNIYQNRPHICRIFGEPSEKMNSKFLHCGWLEGKECDNAISNLEEQEKALADIVFLYLQGKIKI